MCISVRFTADHPLRPYDHRQRVISLPVGMSQRHALVAVRAVLAELAVPQPRSGARCFCGAPVRLLPRVPKQRMEGQVIHHGV